VRDAIERDPRIIVTGFVDDPAPYYQLMDVVALPTHREGYPTVALEAAAACRPLVTTRVPGAVDAVVDQETGLLVPAGDARALAEAVASLLADPARAAAMARRARRLAVTEFCQERVWKAFEQVYRELLGAQQAADATPVIVEGRPFRGPTAPALNRRRVAQVKPRGPAAADEWRSAGHSPNSPGPQTSFWARSGGKRAFDVVVACLGLAVSGPLLLVAAGTVLVSLGWPVLFRQPRSGLAGKRFLICKFRSMAGRGSRGAMAEAERLTLGGRLLRRWSVDELPQLWNVLRGEMSLVGPRPLPVDYEPRYTPRQRRRHDVKPGITGWAQVRGRNSLDWEQRFELDLWYVEHACAWLDCRILLRSVAMVLSGAGVSPHGAPLMPEFLGEARKSD
jgi:lipopolysaccharide/colanic/teichoic acid biosynthesis glycosyltransferase